MKAMTGVSQWFLQPRRCPNPRLRLFCFPYAGGSAAIFSHWPDYVPADIEIWPVQLPGRQNRLSERPLAEISAVVQAFTPVLQEHLDIPFVFFGHCMGAHLSFEVARQLRRQGSQMPVHLFVSARRAPQLPDPNPRFHLLNDALFLKTVRKLNRLPEEFVEDEELARLTISTLQADFRALEMYSYTDEKPFNCPISVFGGTEDASVSTDELVPWHDQTTGMFRIHLLPSEHFFIHSHQAHILKIISQELDSS